MSETHIIPPYGQKMLPKAYTHTHTKNFQTYRNQYIHPPIMPPSFPSFPIPQKSEKTLLSIFHIKKKTSLPVPPSPQMV